MPQKFGQHFLVDSEVLQAMVASVRRFGQYETILEIGPGQGVLTKELVKLAKRVVAVEIDQSLQSSLDALVKEHSNLEVIYGDILKLDLAKIGLKTGEYILASNLPYEITGAVLRQFTSVAPYPAHIALLIQHEVAKRLVAEPGDLSIVGIAVQAFSQPQLIRVVAPDAFNPKPKVNSAIVTLSNIRVQSAVSEDQEAIFFRFVKGGFAQKRKLLRANLQNINVGGKIIPKSAILEAFQSIGLPETVRAQELSVQQWVLLVDKLGSFIV